MKNIISLRFLDNSNGYLKGSTYDYFIDDNLLTNLQLAFASARCTNVFSVVTTTGEGYRGNPIVFTGIRLGLGTEDLKTISKISYYETASYTKNYTRTDRLTAEMVAEYKRSKASKEQAFKDSVKNTGCIPPQLNYGGAVSMASLFDGLEPQAKITRSNDTKESTMNTNNNNLFAGVMKQMQFGPYTDKNVRLSMRGMAVRTPANRFNAYDAVTKTLTDVTDFLLDGFGEVFYMWPMAQKDVAVGDVIFHNGSPIIVTEVNASSLMAIDPSREEVIQKVPATNSFGFNFYSKLVNITEGMFSNVSADQPFGQFPMMMMMMQGGDSNPMIQAYMLSQIMGGGDMGGMMNGMNPLMMVAMMGGNGNSGMNPLMLAAMMGGNMGNMFGVPTVPAAPTVKPVKAPKTNE